jgi:hypothetical protein
MITSGRKDNTNTIDHCARFNGTTLNITARGLIVITIICRNAHIIKDSSNFIFENNPIVLNL